MALIAKKKNINTKKFFASLEFDLFRVQLKLALRIRPKCLIISSLVIGYKVKKLYFTFLTHLQFLQNQ